MKIPRIKKQEAIGKNFKAVGLVIENKIILFNDKILGLLILDPDDNFKWVKIPQINFGDIFK